MHKSGFVNIIGNPNVGKSTLMNALVGERLSIITSKAQTTRHRILGIVNGDDFQIVYSDTPGILKPNYKLHESMMKVVQGALKDADIILYVTDVTEGTEHRNEFVDKILRSGIKTILVINKIDLTNDETETDADVLTSAVTGEGIERLKELLYEKSFGSRGEDAAFLIEERHYDALKRAETALKRAVAACGELSLDLVGIDVGNAWESLGEITGETASESIIEEIFSKFCVGK